MKRETILFLNDILDSIKNIGLFMANVSKKNFYDNKEKQSAVVRQIEIIGEAVKNLPIWLISEYPEVPWKYIAGMRDIITHSYFKLDLDKVWEVIEKDFPDLKEKILKIKQELEKEELQKTQRNKNKEK